jgi:hypothetical protein
LTVKILDEAHLIGDIVKKKLQEVDNPRKEAVRMVRMLENSNNTF